jgi:hypothetical protein
VATSRRPWWPSMAGRQALSTRAFGPRLRRLMGLTGLANPAAVCHQEFDGEVRLTSKCYANNFRSAIFARVLTAVHSA